MRSQRPQSALAEINVTPFVDVVLVLLIIFMVAAPLLGQGIDVALPPAATGRPLNGSGVSITLTKEHVIYLDNDLVTLKELRERLSGHQQQSVAIRADRNAYVSKLVELWDLCRDLGFHEIHISTQAE